MKPTTRFIIVCVIKIWRKRLPRVISQELDPVRILRRATADWMVAMRSPV